VKFTKEVNGEPIVVGETVLIPTIEYSCYSRNINFSMISRSIEITEVTVTPVSLKIIQKDKEWVVPIQEDADDKEVE
jgi:hypothetical protein